MTLTATVAFIPEDFAVKDLANVAWQSSQVVTIDKLWNGAPASRERQTDVRLLWSESAFYVHFIAQQTEPLFLNENPQTARKTMKLWEHDVCELFLASD